jgi:hypothetical protein
MKLADYMALETTVDALRRFARLDDQVAAVTKFRVWTALHPDWIRDGWCYALKKIKRSDPGINRLLAFAQEGLVGVSERDRWEFRLSYTRRALELVEDLEPCEIRDVARADLLETIEGHERHLETLKTEVK